MRRFFALGFFVLMFLLVGCGKHKVSDHPPEVVVQTPDSPASGEVTIQFSVLNHPVSQRVRITIEYSDDGGLSWNPATITYSSGGVIDNNVISELIADTGWVSYSLKWDTLTDVGTTPTTVSIRLTPNDGVQDGEPAQTSEFLVSNNSAPSVALTSPPTSGSGDISLSFNLTDEQSDICSVSFEYSSDGGSTWSPMTIKSASSGSLNPGRVSGLESSPAGVTHSVVWNSADDVSGVNVSVRLRLTPDDGVLTGASATHEMDVNPNDAPSLSAFSAVWRSAESDVEMTFTLSDDQSDACSVRFEYSVDSGASWSPMSLKSSSGGIISGDSVEELSSSPAGLPYSVFWDVEEDLGVVSDVSALVRATPNDGKTGGGAQTDAVTLNPPADAPTCAATSPAPGSVIGGDVMIQFDITDANSDVCNVSVDYSLDAGNIWLAATVVSPDEGTVSGNTIQGVSSSPTGVGHSFTWQTGVDLSGVHNTNVVLRLTVTDGTYSDADARTFEVDNNSRPSVVLSDVTGLQSSDVSISFTLYDVDGHTCSIVAEFSEDGGSTFNPATLKYTSGGELDTGSPNRINGLTSSQTGITYTIIWNSTADSAAQNQEVEVVFRITPSDIYDTGVYDEVTFTLDNRTYFAWSRTDLSAMVPDTVGEPKTVYFNNGVFEAFFVFFCDASTNEIKYIYTTDMSSWNSATVSADFVTYPATDDFDVASSPNYIHLLWCSGNEIRYTTFDGSSWSPASIEVPVISAPRNVTVAANSADEALVVFSDDDGTRRAIYYTMRTGGAWNPDPATIIDSGSSDDCGNPNASCDNYGNFHIAYERWYYGTVGAIEHRMFDAANSSWENARVVSYTRYNAFRPYVTARFYTSGARDYVRVEVVYQEDEGWGGGWDVTRWYGFWWDNSPADNFRYSWSTDSSLVYDTSDTTEPKLTIDALTDRHYLIYLGTAPYGNASFRTELFFRYGMSYTNYLAPLRISENEEVIDVDILLIDSGTLDGVHVVYRYKTATGYALYHTRRDR